MSRIGKEPITVPSGVKIDVAGNIVKVKGPKGELSQSLPPQVKAELTNEALTIAALGQGKEAKAFHGLARSLCFNMVKGVTDGFSKELNIQGVGFRAKLEGKMLNLSLGFSHPIKHSIPEGIKLEVQDQTKITVSGIDKQQVGQVAATIRRYYPAEPYKGKGIRYAGEHVRRKAGKTVAK